MTTSRPPISLPRSPEPPPPHPFPVLATVAPVIASVAIWAFTQSPFAMVFALLGPVIAVASLGDARRQGTKQGKRERERFRTECAAIRRTIEEAHERAAESLDLSAPSALRLLTAPKHDSERWRGSLGEQLPVRLGLGRIASGLLLEPAQPGLDTEGAVAAAIEELRTVAAFLDQAAIVVDARLGIGVCGPEALVASAANAIVVQLANALPPASVEFSVKFAANSAGGNTGSTGGSWDWLALLPQSRNRLHTEREARADPQRQRNVLENSAQQHGIQQYSAQANSAEANSAEANSAQTNSGQERSGQEHGGQERSVQERSVRGRCVQVEARPRAGVPTAGFSGSGSSAASVVVAVAERESELPRECRVVLQLGGAGSARLVRHPEPDRVVALRPEFVSTEQAREFAALLREAAGGSAPDAALPGLAPFRELVHAAIPGRGSLACPIGVGAQGPIVVDLVADGPHAVIGGTTGSGKSELLVSWVLAMAASCSPEQLNFLLVDFKGGSAFSAVRELPHTVGLVTDLDEAAAHRAMLSLRAELRYRERVLAESGARSTLELDAGVVLPRLVIVVDEFQALTESYPELHELFADLAARGRSLGVHLILCAQRPAGAVRDAVLANCTLRMSLRVNNRADSVAVIGSPAAAELPRHPVGRALLARDGGECLAVQLALATAQDVGAVAARWPGPWIPRRPWLDPLPSRLDPLDPAITDDPGIPFGLLDLPESQQQSVALYDPDAEGSLLVVGGHRAGKSGVLAAIASAATPGSVRWVPSSLEGAWDEILAALATVRDGTSPGGLLLFDDVDNVLGRMPQDYEQAFLDALTGLLREGSRVGLQLVFSTSRVTSSLQTLATLCDSRLVLRLPDRQEHLLAGASGAAFDPALPTGGGHWRGHRVQVALVASPPPAARPPLPILDSAGWPGIAVVATAPQAIVERLRELGEVTLLGPGASTEALEVAAPSGAEPTPRRPRILLGDPDAWQAEWGIIGRLRARMPIAFHGCSTAEFRALTHLKVLPPPISAAANTVWLLSPDGEVGRAMLP